MRYFLSNLSTVPASKRPSLSLSCTQLHSNVPCHQHKAFKPSDTALERRVTYLVLFKASSHFYYFSETVTLGIAVESPSCCSKWTPSRGVTGEGCVWSLYHQHRQSHHSAAWECPALVSSRCLWLNCDFWNSKKLFGTAFCMTRSFAQSCFFLVPILTSSGALRCFVSTPGLSKSRDFEFVNTTGVRVKQKPFFSQKKDPASEATSSDFHPFCNQGELGCKYCSLWEA